MITIENFKELTKQCSLWLQTADIYWESTGVGPDEFSKNWNMIPLSNVEVLNEDVERFNQYLAGTISESNFIGKCVSFIELICKDNELQIPQFYNNLKVLDS